MFGGGGAAPGFSSSSSSINLKLLLLLPGFIVQRHSKDKDKDKDKDNPSEGEMVASCLRRWSLLLCADMCRTQEAEDTIGTALEQRAETC